MVQSDIQISIITINYNGLANTCALIETIPFNDSLIMHPQKTKRHLLSNATHR